MKLKLKEIRQSKGLSQTEIAKILNITQASYSHYENGRNQPTYELLTNIADFYKVTVDELIGHKVPYLIDKSDFNEVQLEIIEELKTLNIEQSYMLLAYIDGIKQGQEKRNQIIEKLKK